jgi:hypothetical protein
MPRGFTRYSELASNRYDLEQSHAPSLVAASLFKSCNLEWHMRIWRVAEKNALIGRMRF